MTSPRIDAVAIDGPASSGKSTLAKEVARLLGFVFVDTGALYRAVALALLSLARDNLVEQDPEVLRVLSSLDISVSPTPSGARIILKGSDVTSQLRAEQVGDLASKISAWPSVRKALFDLQRSLAIKGHIVMDGRDIGTIIIPEARLKIFLIADPEIRAKRRYDDLLRMGESTSLDAVLADILERDRRDRERLIAPLVPASDALTLDTSHLTIHEAATWIVSRYQ